MNNIDIQSKSKLTKYFIFHLRFVEHVFHSLKNVQSVMEVATIFGQHRWKLENILFNKSLLTKECLIAFEKLEVESMALT